MARLFRMYAHEIEASPIFFLLPTMYELEKPFKGIKYIYAEPYLDHENFMRYSNNFLYCKDEIKASFSHFSYVYSQGRL